MEKKDDVGGAGQGDSRDNRVAVITGASRGLGAGLAAAFGARGMRLGLCARTIPEAPPGVEAVCSSVNVRSAAAVEAFAEQVHEAFGGIDLWINNAGVLEPMAPLRRVASEDFARHLEINVQGVFHGSRTFARHRRALGRGAGTLINISSGAGRHPYEGWGAYCAGKAAVDRLSEVLALEERAAGLRVYSVAPGVIDTDMQETIRSTSAEDFPAVERFREMKRQGSAFSTPEQVAAGLLTLASSEPAHGEVLVDLRQLNT